MSMHFLITSGPGCATRYGSSLLTLVMVFLGARLAKYPGTYYFAVWKKAIKHETIAFEDQVIIWENQLRCAPSCTKRILTEALFTLHTFSLSLLVDNFSAPFTSLVNIDLIINFITFSLKIRKNKIVLQHMSYQMPRR